MIPMMLLFGESAQKRSVDFLKYNETSGLGMIQALTKSASPFGYAQ
jgi:hypothetical protein